MTRVWTKSNPGPADMNAVARTNWTPDQVIKPAGRCAAVQTEHLLRFGVVLLSRFIEQTNGPSLSPICCNALSKVAKKG